MLDVQYYDHIFVFFLNGTRVKARQLSLFLMNPFPQPLLNVNIACNVLGLSYACVLLVVG